MQLTYRGQAYSYPHSEPDQVSNFQPLRIYRGVKISVAPAAPKTTIPSVASLSYRGSSYLRTLTSTFN